MAFSNSLFNIYLIIIDTMKENYISLWLKVVKIWIGLSMLYLQERKSLNNRIKFYNLR